MATLATLVFLRFTSSAYVKSTSSRGLRSLRPCSFTSSCCALSAQAPCGLRAFSISAPLHSGHSRWSKIKHDKAKVDARTTKARSFLARALEAASKDGGSDPQANPRLPPLLRQAASIGFAKTSIAAALARGQGLSPSGTVLAPYSIELMHAPTGAAAIVDCLTDNKAKTLQHVREAMRLHDASATATEWMFERRGRIVFGPRHGSASEEGKETPAPEEWSEEMEMLYVDAASAAGALDVEFPLADPGGVAEDLEDAHAVVYTEPQQMAAVAAAMGKAFGGVKPERAELVWVPKPDSTIEAQPEDEDGKWKSLSKMVERIEDESTVQTVWLNVR